MQGPSEPKDDATLRETVNSGTPLCKTAIYTSHWYGVTILKAGGRRDRNQKFRAL